MSLVFGSKLVAEAGSVRLKMIRVRNVVPVLFLLVQAACASKNEFLNALNQRAAQTSILKNSIALSSEQSNNLRVTKDLTVSPLRPR